jgi:hypothetical protein
LDRRLEERIAGMVELRTGFSCAKGLLGRDFVRPFAVSLIILLFMAVAHLAIAQIPTTITVQGSLLDDLGEPKIGAHTITLRLHAEAVAGEVLYEEIHIGIASVEGVIEMPLGAGIATLGGTHSNLLDVINEASPPWLEMLVDGESLGARQPVRGVAYALLALQSEDSDRLGGELGSAWQRRVVGSCPAENAIREISADGSVTCSADVGDFLSDGLGLSLVGTTFSVDLGVVQKRVLGSCGAGEAIRSIDVDGNVVCETDTDTDSTYSPGAGLSLNGTTFTPDLSYVQARIQRGCAVGSAMTAITEGGAPVCTSVLQGDLTAITTLAGSGLDGGCTQGSCTLSVDTNEIQARVASACPSTQGIRTIDASGGRTCQTLYAGDVSGVVASNTSGISMSGPGVTYSGATGWSCASGGCALSLDTTQYQARVANSCGSGFVIKSVGSTGLVSCTRVATGDITRIEPTSAGGIETQDCTGDACTLKANTRDFIRVGSTSSTNRVIDTIGETISSYGFTAPGGVSGNLVVYASAWVSCWDCPSNAGSMWSTLTTDSAGKGTSGSYTQTDSLSTNGLVGVSLSEVFPVSAGASVSIYWRAQIVALGLMELGVFDPQVTAVFIPN